MIEDFGAEAPLALPVETPGLLPAPASGREEEGAKGERGSLEEVRLMPGDALQLQPLLEGQVDRYTVRVIGVMRGKSVLVTAPALDGKLIFVRDGQPFQVRAFSRLNVCGFKTRILKSQLVPFPYVHLAYPESVSLMRIRKAVRAPVQLIVAISDSEGGRQLAAGRIVDLSVGGARIQVGSALFKQGDAIFLSFKIKLDDLEEYITTSATVRHVEEEAGEARHSWLLGTQFNELGQGPKLIIMSLVYQHMLKDKD
jgi:c-di-GMP-binding flagellar brake protein YcgR